MGTHVEGSLETVARSAAGLLTKVQPSMLCGVLPHQGLPERLHYPTLRRCSLQPSDRFRV
jgi:hypothetical protein